MKLRKRWLAAAVVLVLLVVVPMAVLYSSTVLRVAAQQAERHVPGLSIGAVDGRIATGIRLTDLRWRDDDVEVSVGHAHADWRVLPLLTGRVRIGTLTLRDVDVAMVTRDAGGRNGGATDFDVPFDISVRRMHVEPFTFTLDDEHMLSVSTINGSRLRIVGRRIEMRALDAHWSLPDGPEGVLSMSGRSDESFSIELQDSEEMVSIVGRVYRPLADPSVELTVLAQRLRPDAWLEDAPVAALDGEFTLVGWIEDLAIAGQLRVTAPDMPVSDTRFEARWGRSLLTLRRFDARVDGYPVVLDGSGRYDWSDPLHTAALQARWRADDEGWPIPTGRVRAELDGGSLLIDSEADVLDGTATLQGVLAWPFEDGTPRGRADLAWQDLRHDAVTSRTGRIELRGGWDRWTATLEHARLALDAHDIELSGRVAGRGLAIDELDLAARGRDARLTLSGSWREMVDLRWRVDVPDLSDFHTTMSGSIRGAGTVSGAPASPTLVAGLDASTSFGDVSVQARASWRDDMLSGTLRSATLTPTGRAGWRLTEATAFELSATRAALGRACWRQADRIHLLCVDGDWSAADGVLANLESVEIALAEFEEWLPPGFIYEGTVGGVATIRVAPDGALTADGTLTLGAGAWRQELGEETVSLLRWNEAVVEGRFVDGTIDGDARIALADGGRLDATISLPVLDNQSGGVGERPLRAHFRGAFSDFDLLPAMLPEIGAVSGQVTTDLRVDGTRSRPAFSGTVDIVDGLMTLPQLGLRLTGLTLSVEGDRETLSLRASARSGEGDVEAAGTFRLDDGRVRGDATLRGDGFQAMNQPEADIRLSPDLTLEVDGHTVRVGGSMHIPYARIAPRDRAGVVQRSSDEILVDVTEDAAADLWRIHTRVRMTVGDARFHGFGLSGRITGGLTVIDEPGLPTRATGELQIQDGRYEAWGQQLEIERGRLVYTGGPITEPGLDVRAVRRPRDVMVGIHVRGTLQEPELRLISDPPMQQAELLSWLVLGLPLQQTGGNDQQLLDSAARGAGLAGGGLLAREVGRRLGLSDVGIEHGAHPDQAALVIGHYLSPRVYVAYGIGIFDPEQSLRLRYHLSRLWSIEARTSERATSADLKYSIER